MLSKSLNGDLFRDARESLKVEPGYQKLGKIEQLSKINHISTAVGIAKMGSKKQGDYELVYGKTCKYEDGFF